jgi:DNA modification methylase
MTAVGMIVAMAKKMSKTYKKATSSSIESRNMVQEDSCEFTKLLQIGHKRSCDCRPTHLNCMEAKEWLKSQLGVWRFTYEGRDVRDKSAHPATFPIALSKKVIELFSHKGELVLDPFVGSGTTLVAANDLNRNAVGFDLQEKYVLLCENRLKQVDLFNSTKQIAIQDDARNIKKYLPDNSVKLIWTSPPYANLLNRKRKNKSRRDRNNEQLGKIEQYSQDSRDLGTMSLDEYAKAMGDIFEPLLEALQPKGHCVINVPDMWWENQRITIHVSLIEELRKRGYELRNIIIWDRTNIVNRIGIFGWPSNYITMGVTFEYLLDFWKPPRRIEF